MYKKISLALVLFFAVIVLSACSNSLDTSEEVDLETNGLVNDQSNNQDINESKSNEYQCLSEPVKVSTLKIGDMFGTHKIKVISGSMNEEVCQANSGNIEFEGEETVSGKIYFSDYVWSMRFVPTDESWIPWFVFNSENNFNDVSLKGLCAGYPVGLYLDYNLSQLDQFPELKEFMSESSDGEQYTKNVTIKIDNFKIFFSTGGEGGASATLKDVISISD